jgi:glycosyltransferase involved in cell wall biosynthesis
VTPPLVSVLIPAYNAARHIRATIASALAQTWPRIEVIVVDDGSEDDTAGIAEGFGRERVRVIRQGRKGPSAAQNELLRQAKGDFIQRLDADDLLSPRKIELQLAHISADAGVLAVGEWARFATDPAEALFDAPEAGGVAQSMSPIEWLVGDGRNGLPMLQPGLWLASRRLADKAGEWDERLTLNNDFDYGVRLLLAADRVVRTPGARLFYRSGNASSLASTRGIAAWRSSLQSMEQGSRAMLEASPTAETKRACANMFQQLAFTTYLDAPDVCAAAEARVKALGGADVVMDGGALFRLLRTALGWRRASRVKRAAYRAGYERIAALKEQRRAW